jgi:hypothetical protein
MQSPGPATLASAFRRWSVVGARRAFASIFLEHDPVGFQGQDNKNLINNRQAGRRRGRGGQQQRSQGGGNPGRLDTGNRIDNRARGNAAQLLEKYKTLARDAQMQGDRVNVEYYLQFADHYFRVLAETRARIEENGGPVQRRIQGATLDEDDTEFEDEGERIAPAEQQRGGQNGYRQDGRQDGRQEGRQENRDSNRQDGNRSDARQESRQDNGRQDGNRPDVRQDTYRPDNRSDADRGYTRNGNRSLGDAQNGATDSRGGDDQNERPRRASNGNAQDEGGYDRSREDRPREDRKRDTARTEERAPRDVRSEDAPLPSATEAQPEAMEAVVPIQPEASEPPRRGRGRPRRDATAVAPEPVAATTDSSDEGEDNGFSADLLPPSLNVSAVTPGDADGEAEKPRRRRGRPPIVRETDPVA